jgi:integrase
LKSPRQAADSSNLYKRPRADLPEIDLHDVRHKHSKVNVDAKIDWKTLSQYLGHAEVAFTLKQYVQTRLQAGRTVANAPSALIVGGSIASTQITDEARADQGATVGGDSGEAA